MCFYNNSVALPFYPSVGTSKVDHLLMRPDEYYAFFSSVSEIFSFYYLTEEIILTVKNWYYIIIKVKSEVTDYDEDILYKNSTCFKYIKCVMKLLYMLCITSIQLRSLIYT